MIEEGNMPSRDTYLHMLSVIAEGARQVIILTKKGSNLKP